MNLLRISFFASEGSNEPKALDVPWDQLATQLQSPVRAPCTLATCPGSKCPHKLGQAWSPAAYPPGLTRAKKNVSAVAALVLDLDHLTEIQFAAVALKLQPYRYIAHATHSDREGDRCVRLVLALDAPVAGADWDRFWLQAIAELGLPLAHKRDKLGGIDAPTRDPSRLFFLPSRPHDAPFLGATNQGIAIDVAATLARAPAAAPTEPLAVPSAAQLASPEVMHTAALQLAAVWPERGRHDAFLALAGALAKHGWPAEAITDLTTRVARLMPNSDEKAVHDRPLQAADSVAKVQRGEQVTSWGTLASHLTNPDALDSVRERLGMLDPDPTGGVLLQPLVAVPSLAPIPIASPMSALVSERAQYGDDLGAFLGDDDPGEDPEAWLIHTIMPAGVPVVIAGHPKSCKTFLGEHMSICLAAGIPWLGHATRRCRVLILAREDSVRETRRRIWRLARGLGLDPRDLAGWLRIDCKTPFYFSSSEDVAKMQRTIEAWRPALIVIDSLSRTHQGDENSKKEMSVVTSTWGDLCQLYDLTIAPIHHFTKTGEGTLLQRLRGSGDLGALVRHIVGVDKQPGGATELSFDGNLAQLPQPFLVRMVDAIDEHGRKVIRFEDGGSALSSHFQRIDQAILDYIGNADTGGVTGAQIERAISGNNDVKRERLKQLLLAGKISRPHKRYHPAIAPREVPAHVVIGARLIDPEGSP